MTDPRHGLIRHTPPPPCLLHARPPALPVRPPALVSLQRHQRSPCAVAPPPTADLTRPCRCTIVADWSQLPPHCAALRQPPSAVLMLAVAHACAPVRSRGGGADVGPGDAHRRRGGSVHGEHRG